MIHKDEHYSLDSQGLIVEHVGPWAIDKLKIVTDYIQASGAARRHYLGTGAAYIDVFWRTRTIKDSYYPKAYRWKSSSSVQEV